MSINEKFIDIADLNILYDAFIASMKGSSWKGQSQRFEANFLHELIQLKNELILKEYKTSPGSEFIQYERGKIRYIHGAIIRDRIVRHALCDNILNPSLRPYLIYNNGASQKGKGVGFARNMFERDLHNYWLENRTNDGYVGLVDLSKFYDNIQHKKIKEELYPKVDKSILWLLDEILKTFEIDVSYMSDDEYEDCLNIKFDSVDYHAKIPKDKMTGKKMMAKSIDIGDQVSQSVGVFFPTKIDNYVKIVCGCKRYGRYMDDMYIIGKTREEVQSIINGIAEQAEKLGLFINMKKTKIVKLSSNYKFLQIRYSLTETGRVIRRITSKALKRERKKLKAYQRLLIKRMMTYDNIEQAYKSWMGSFIYIMSKKQILRMQQHYKKLFGKEPKWKT